MKQTIPFSFTLNVQDLNPIPVGVIPAFPISKMHPDYPGLLTWAKGVAAGSTDHQEYLFGVAQAWNADGRTNDTLKKWCLATFRWFLGVQMTKWNAGQSVTGFSFDSYLYAGDTMGHFVVVLNWMRDALTAQEIHDAEMLCEQATFNIWNPKLATWGGVAQPWNGWAIDNPRNNYWYRSFLKATAYWAAYSQSPTWAAKVASLLQDMAAGYINCQGGVVAEGTGYSGAIWTLFVDLWFIKQTLGIDATVAGRVTETLAYWWHATTPSKTAYVPIGDQAHGSGSWPTVEDGHKSIMLWGSLLRPDDAEAAYARQWLATVGIKAARADDRYYLCIDSPGPAVAPTANSYFASGAGHLFARHTDGSMIAFTAGRNTEDHAHFDAMELQLAMGTWSKGTATANIVSTNGLEKTPYYHNVPLFLTSAGVRIPAKRTNANPLTWNDDGSLLTARCDGSASYAGTDVKACARDVTYDRVNRKATAHDTATLANGAAMTQLWSVFVQPVLNADGTVAAGGLTFRSPGASIRQPFMDYHDGVSGADFPAGKVWRIEFFGASEYTTELTW